MPTAASPSRSRCRSTWGIGKGSKRNRLHGGALGLLRIAATRFRATIVRRPPGVCDFRPTNSVMNVGRALPVFTAHCAQDRFRAAALNLSDYQQDNQDQQQQTDAPAGVVAE